MMTRTIQIAGGALVAVALMCATPRPAPAAPAAPDPTLAAAKAAFLKGQQLYLQKKFKEAAAAFLEAHKAKPIPAFLFNAAVAYEKGKAYVEAVKYFKAYLDKVPKAKDGAQIKKRIAALEKALQDAAAANQPRRRVVEPPPRRGDPPRRRVVEPPVRRVAVVVPVLPAIKPKGVVVISTKPAGANIYLNSKLNQLGTSPWEGSLPTGEHKLIIEHRGYKPETKVISVSPDRLLDVYVALSREHYLGWFRITANTPRAKVYIDKKAFGHVGYTPYTGFLKPGKHTVWVGKVGFGMAKKVIDITSGKTHNFHLTLSKLKHGWLSIAGATAYGAQVKLNGKKLCTVPCDRVVVQPGKHRLEIEAKGKKTLKSDVVVRRLRLHTARVKLEKKPSLVSAIVAYSFAAGFLTGGIVLGWLSKKITDEVKDDIAQNQLINSSDPRFKRGRIYAYISNGLFGLAGVAAIFGVYYTFADRGPKSAVRYYEKNFGNLAPEFGPGYAGVRGKWRW